jgi:hypothetical protein
LQRNRLYHGRCACLAHINRQAESRPLHIYSIKYCACSILLVPHALYLPMAIMCMWHADDRIRRSMGLGKAGVDWSLDSKGDSVSGDCGQPPRATACKVPTGGVHWDGCHTYLHATLRYTFRGGAHGVIGGPHRASGDTAQSVRRYSRATALPCMEFAL